MLLRLSLILFCFVTIASCAKTSQNFLINAKTLSPILEVKTPGAGAECSNRELHFAVSQDNKIDLETCDKGRCIKTDPDSLKFMDRSAVVNPNNILLGSGDTSKGPVIPAEGPDGLLWLCREDEEEQVCICIPWAQD